MENNSEEEFELKRLLQENDKLRKRKESKFKLLNNLSDVLEIWCSKLAMKFENDIKINQKVSVLEYDFKKVKEKESELISVSCNWNARFFNIQEV